MELSTKTMNFQPPPNRSTLMALKSLATLNGNVLRQLFRSSSRRLRDSKRSSAGTDSSTGPEFQAIGIHRSFPLPVLALRSVAGGGSGRPLTYQGRTPHFYPVRERKRLLGCTAGESLRQSKDSADDEEVVTIRLRDPKGTIIKRCIDQIDSSKGLRREDSMLHGEFCIEFNDFRNYFACIEICHSPEEWNSYCIDGCWADKTAGGFTDNYLDNPQYLVETASDLEFGNVTLTVELTQKDRRELGKEYLAIGLHLYVLPPDTELPLSSVNEIPFERQTHELSRTNAVMDRYTLTLPCQFLLVPYTENAGDPAQFMIRIFSDQPLTHRSIQ